MTATRPSGPPVLRRRGLAAALVLVLAALGGAGAVHGAVDQPQVAAPPSAAAETTTPEEQPTPACTEPATEPTAPPAPDPARGEPVRLVVPAIDVDAEVVPVSMGADESIVPPADVTQVGWWSSSAVPGSVEGTTMIVGHSVRLGDGVFDDLSDLERGDTIRVRTAKGRVTYRVSEVADLTKDQVEKKADQLFSQDVDGRLVLVTCSGYHRGSYGKNTVVVAHPATT